MITHTTESYWIPSQKKAKSKLQIQRICQNLKFLILKQILHATHLLKLLDKMHKYETNMDRVKPVYPAFNIVEVGEGGS